MRIFVFPFLLALVAWTFASTAVAQTRNDSASERLGWHLTTDGGIAYRRDPKTPRHSHLSTGRPISFYESIEAAHECGAKYIGLHFWDRLSPENPALIDDTLVPALRMELKAKLAAAGLKIASYEAKSFGKDAAAARRAFEFARDMGATVIITYAPADSFDLLDQLTGQYSMNVALRGSSADLGSPWDPKTFLDATKGHSARIGVRADSVAWSEVGLNPLDSLKKLEGRIMAVAFQGVSDDEEKRERFDGGPRLTSVLAELRRQNYRGPLLMFVEGGDRNNYGKQCVACFDRVVAALAL